MEHYQIPTCTIPKPQTIRNVDGTENKHGKVKLATNINIRYNGIKTMHTFYVINLRLDHMLLGMPFLAAMNLNIDWTKGTFRGKVIASSIVTATSGGNSRLLSRTRVKRRPIRLLVSLSSKLHASLVR